MILLSLHDIVAGYGIIQVLRGISLDIHEKEVLTLIGANGAGKTTLIKVVSGFLNPFSGTVEFLGENLVGLPPDKIVKRGICQVFERARVFPNFSVIENLEMGAFLRRDKMAILEDLDRIFALFPILKDRVKQEAGTLSGGERQMLAMGRALMTRPKLYLLDEPSLGLSPMLVKELGEIINEIKDQGLTILLVEQNARMAMRIANRVCVLENGNIVLEGLAKELMSNEEVKKSYLGM
jgi:branched-chain amino acid transport system ATP-binding protein